MHQITIEEWAKATFEEPTMSVPDVPEDSEEDIEIVPEKKCRDCLMFYWLKECSIDVALDADQKHTEDSKTCSHFCDKGRWGL